MANPIRQPLGKVPPKMNYPSTQNNNETIYRYTVQLKSITNALKLYEIANSVGSEIIAIDYGNYKANCKNRSELLSLNLLSRLTLLSSSEDDLETIRKRITLFGASMNKYTILTSDVTDEELNRLLGINK